MEIIVTDLTKFYNDEIVCTAGITRNSDECIRPRPYLKLSWCKENKVVPGSVLNGKFEKQTGEAPHVEDHWCDEYLINKGKCSSEEFKNILQVTEERSVEEGFQGQIADGEKYFPLDSPPKRSIITISIKPSNIRIIRNNFNSEKTQVFFTDNSGREYKRITVTDLGFFYYAQKYDDPSLTTLNTFLREQNDLFLRIGLSRKYENNGRIGFWLQINGIYTFPKYLKKTRIYV